MLMSVWHELRGTNCCLTKSQSFDTVITVPQCPLTFILVFLTMSYESLLMPLLWKFLGALLKDENVCLFKQNNHLNKISATWVPYSTMTLHTGIPIVPSPSP